MEETANGGVSIQPIFPMSSYSGGEIDFEELQCIPQGPECNIVEDTELTLDVIEVMGEESRVIFPVKSSSPYLVFHIKNVGRFISFTLCVADEKARRVIGMSNRRSNVHIEKNSCQIPLDVGDGWQYMCISVEDLMQRAFGSQRFCCHEICINGSCRIARLFFQDEMYSDAELPSYLRVVNEATS